MSLKTVKNVNVYKNNGLYFINMDYEIEDKIFFFFKRKRIINEDLGFYAKTTEINHGSRFWIRYAFKSEGDALLYTQNKLAQNNIHLYIEYNIYKNTYHWCAKIKSYKDYVEYTPITYKYSKDAIQKHMRQISDVLRLEYIGHNTYVEF